MTLSDLSIKRPVFAWILMFGLIFFGVLSFQRMGINENPDVEFPTITINYNYDGATPRVIEKDVVEPAESVLVTMEGIRNMQSTSSRGTARITLEFELSRDIDFALQEVNTLLSRAQRQLPETLDPPVVTKSNAADEPIMYMALSTETLSFRELMILFRDRIRDRISTVDGVAEVRPFGFHEPVLRVDLLADKLKEYELTANDVVNSINREHKELPAGKFEYLDEEELIRIMGEANEVEEFQNMIISRRGGSPNFVPIRLRDVANVYEGTEVIRRISRVNGVQAMGMAVQKQRGVNAVATVDRVHERLKEINANLPPGTQLTVNFDRTQFVRESVNELVFTLILSALLTSLVCWLFIGSFSATINILLAIPTAIIGTFIFIEWLGFTLNTFSLLGLALAIGVVVDDAIVMLENIIRFMQNGYNRVNAAFKGAREISFAVIATTVALVSIFIPITFLPGIEGRFFFEFAATISIAVALSSLEALTLAPMRCSQFLTLAESRMWVGRKFEGFIELLGRIYKGTLEYSLNHRVLTVALSTILFGGSLFTFKFLSTEFVPAQDRGVLFLIFIAPDGKSMEYTDARVKKFEKMVMEHPSVRRVFVAVGGFGRGGQGNRGNGVVILKNRNERDKSQVEVASELRKQAKGIEGIRVIIRDRFGSALGGRRGSPVEFTINGPEEEKRREIWAEFKKRMEADPDITGARSDDVRLLPEVHIVPDREKAIQSGVEIQEIAEVVNSTFGGRVAGQYTDEGRRFNIYVQLKEEDRQRPENVDPVLIRNNRGQTLSLADVVELKKTSGPQAVFREDRLPGLRVDANLAAGAKLGTVIDKVNEWSKEILPEKYFIKYSATPQDKLTEILVIMLLGLVIAYMILASQFNSFIDPLIVFLAIPFGLTGSVMALMIGGHTLNVYSVIGILLTMGIVKKNSILLVEFTNQLRDRGMETLEAMKQACSVRLRPILMTNTATIAAAIPPALALGPGSETRVPMALTVIGGIIVSMLFTLYVVPCVYCMISPQRKVILEED